jgi:hypothetical protein
VPSVVSVTVLFTQYNVHETVSQRVWTVPQAIRQPVFTTLVSVHQLTGRNRKFRAQCLDVLFCFSNFSLLVAAKTSPPAWRGSADYSRAEVHPFSGRGCRFWLRASRLKDVDESRSETSFVEEMAQHTGPRKEALHAGYMSYEAPPAALYCCTDSFLALHTGLHVSTSPRPTFRPLFNSSSCHHLYIHFALARR